MKHLLSIDKTNFALITNLFYINERSLQGSNKPVPNISHAFHGFFTGLLFRLTYLNLPVTFKTIHLPCFKTVVSELVSIVLQR